MKSSATTPLMDIHAALEFCAEYTRSNSYFDGERLKEKEGAALSKEDVRLIQIMAEQRIEGAERAFLEEQLRLAIKDEVMVAYGYLAPFKRGQKPQRIDPAQWAYLKLDTEAESAAGKGQEFTGLRFGLAPNPATDATANQHRRPSQKAEILRIFDANQAALLELPRKADIYRRVHEIAREKWGSAVKGFDVTTIRDHLRDEGKLSGWKERKRE